MENLLCLNCELYRLKINMPTRPCREKNQLGRCRGTLLSRRRLYCRRHNVQMGWKKIRDKCRHRKPYCPENMWQWCHIDQLHLKEL